MNFLKLTQEQIQLNITALQLQLSADNFVLKAQKSHLQSLLNNNEGFLKLVNQQIEIERLEIEL